MLVIDAVAVGVAYCCILNKEAWRGGIWHFGANGDKEIECQTSVQMCSMLSEQRSSNS